MSGTTPENEQQVYFRNRRKKYNENNGDTKRMVDSDRRKAEEDPVLNEDVEEFDRLAAEYSASPDSSSPTNG